MYPTCSMWSNEFKCFIKEPKKLSISHNIFKLVLPYSADIHVFAFHTPRKIPDQVQILLSRRSYLNPLHVFPASLCWLQAAAQVTRSPVLRSDRKVVCRSDSVKLEFLSNRALWAATMPDRRMGRRHWAGIPQDTMVTAGLCKYLPRAFTLSLYGHLPLTVGKHHAINRLLTSTDQAVATCMKI